MLHLGRKARSCYIEDVLDQAAAADKAEGVAITEVCDSRLQDAQKEASL
jgi:hypothetical protein